ncbi:LysR family transcriptional regulator (plasmid) [Rhodococcus pyridinivorans]|uniref:LysR family transcriptional regulator n=1 Tax=Rhodococcus TaxID=1827 RepID=UPI0007D94809|nr:MULTISPECIES: LysR family transcriptional regulator [Rhodococcus]MCT7293656.1 LysR family transcriptional regulator [Rhodococcus sp. PAE-6]QXU56439.1 LysR family transcriptional regulator [Rhodococcus sp. LW-XY12]UQB75809.1 LysR family transcriptional regulator [Rhodococcus ruber]UVT27497.1 LysR family transcriptional regulator [Rhodococcus pyridinivorans]WML66340.1 LysR family transcriptional regulator [Rhodococcus sp. AH-ZY2]
MDLRLLRYFVAVIDHGNVTAAAQALYMSQPSLSQAMRTLAKRLDVTLFTRVGRQLQLTPEGRELEVQAREIIEQVDLARAQVEEVVQLRTGRVTVATSSTFGVFPLPAIARAMLARHPQIQVVVLDGRSPEGAATLVRNGAAELGFVELPMHEESLVTHLLGSEEIVVVGAESVIGDGAEPLTKAQTRLLPFALLDRASAGQSRSARHIVAVAERVLLTAAERETLWDVVSYGAVATFVSDAAADIVLPGTPRRSLSPPLLRDVGLVHRTGPLTPAAQAFVRAARLVSASALQTSTKS